jgi:phosphatidylglycerol:prolipoprotein diacylglycerol transferase
MFINNFDPVAFNFFSIEIRWYSLAYIFGILLGWNYCKKILVNNKKIYIIFDDLIPYLILGVIIGGRLGYVIFYNFNYYIKNLQEIFFIWNGGMSFHGGLLGVFFAVIFFCKKNNLDKYIFLDLISSAAPIGIFLGRISNFLNSELFGKSTDLPWSVTFIRIDNIPRHPSQLYEAGLEGFLLFFILLYFIKKKYFLVPGLISSLFLIFYSLFRFLIEFVRIPDEQLGYLVFNLTMGQIISIVFLIWGTYLFIIKKNEFK